MNFYYESYMSPCRDIMVLLHSGGNVAIKTKLITAVLNLAEIRTLL